MKIKIFKNFFILIIVLLFSLFLVDNVLAEELPVPEVKTKLKVSEDGYIAEITWSMSEKGQYGFLVEREVDGNRVYLSDLSPKKEGVEGITDGGFFVDGYLEEGKEYTYYVKTYDRGGNESKFGSSSVVAEDISSCQNKFDIFKAEQQEKSVKIHWNSVCNAVEYKLYRDGKLITTTNKTEYVDEEIEGGEYEYSIEAYDQKTEGKIYIKKVLAIDPIDSASTTVNVSGSGASNTGSGNMDFNINSPVSGSLKNITENVIDILFSLAGLVALFYVIIGGYSYITSGGDPEASEAAKVTITNAIIGLVIILASYLIIEFLMVEIGINSSFSVF